MKNMCNKTTKAIAAGRVLLQQGRRAPEGSEESQPGRPCAGGFVLLSQGAGAPAPRGLLTKGHQWGGCITVRKSWSGDSGPPRDTRHRPDKSIGPNGRAGVITARC